jgi:hypothetical protein
MGTAALPARRSQIKSIKDQGYAPASRTLASKVWWVCSINQERRDAYAAESSIRPVDDLRHHDLRNRVLGISRFQLPWEAKCHTLGIASFALP